MAEVTTAQICDGVESTLADADEVDFTYSYNELKEGIHDQKVLEVYPQAGNQDPSGTADRTTFRAGVRQTSLTVRADYYAKRRSEIGEDMGQMVAGIDSIIGIIEAQDTKPYFGVEGIKAFRWSWQRVTFERGDPLARYVGARFEFEMRIF